MRTCSSSLPKVAGPNPEKLMTAGSLRRPEAVDVPAPSAEAGGAASGRDVVDADPVGADGSGGFGGEHATSAANESSGARRAQVCMDAIPDQCGAEVSSATA